MTGNFEIIRLDPIFKIHKPCMLVFHFLLNILYTEASSRILLLFFFSVIPPLLMH